MSLYLFVKLALWAVAHASPAAEKFSFCEDAKCQHCPVSVPSAGTGFPQCVIYNSADVLKNQQFPDNEGG